LAENFPKLGFMAPDLATRDLKLSSKLVQNTKVKVEFKRLDDP